MGSERLRKLFVGGVVVVLGIVAVAAWAGGSADETGRDTYNPNKTKFAWTSKEAQTSSTEFKRVPNMGIPPMKHRGPMVATYTVKLAGAPAQFKIEEHRFRPRLTTFDPDGTDTFSFTAVLDRDDWRCDSPGLQWRSPSGGMVTLKYASVVVDHRREREEPDFGCRAL